VLVKGSQQAPSKDVDCTTDEQEQPLKTIAGIAFADGSVRISGVIFLGILGRARRRFCWCRFIICRSGWRTKRRRRRL